MLLKRDARRKRRAVFAVDWRPLSVCPSNTFMYYIQTAEAIVKLLSCSGSPIILVFDLMLHCKASSLDIAI